MYAKMGAFVGRGHPGRRAAGDRRPRPARRRHQGQVRDGEFTVLDGPFSEAKELVGGWALMEVRDKDEVIEWTKRFLAIAGGRRVHHARGLLTTPSRRGRAARSAAAAGPRWRVGGRCHGILERLPRPEICPIGRPVV